MLEEHLNNIRINSPPPLGNDLPTNTRDKSPIIKNIVGLTDLPEELIRYIAFDSGLDFIDYQSFSVVFKDILPSVESISEGIDNNRYSAEWHRKYASLFCGPKAQLASHKVKGVLLQALENCRCRIESKTDLLIIETYHAHERDAFETPAYIVFNHYFECVAMALGARDIISFRTYGGTGNKKFPLGGKIAFYIQDINKETLGIMLESMSAEFNKDKKTSQLLAAFIAHKMKNFFTDRKPNNISRGDVFQCFSACPELIKTGEFVSNYLANKKYTQNNSSDL